MIFGIGLIVCCMADPANVLGFPNVARMWNPSLILVMGRGFNWIPCFFLCRTASGDIIGSGIEIACGNENRGG
jgi:hypothetical protein